jgi:hypothetical protein
MKRILRKLAKLVLCLGVLAASLLPDPAMAQVIVIAPPSAFVATARPVYHGGYHSYWYNGRWVYRHGGRWYAWRSEPAYLHTYRTRAVPVRHVYTRAYYHGRRR